MEQRHLTVTCSGCGATSSRVPASLAGRTIRCSRCGARSTAPSLPAAQPPPSAPPPTERPAEAPTILEGLDDDGPIASILETHEEPAATVLETDEPAATRLEDGAGAPTALEDGAAAPTARERSRPLAGGGSAEPLTTSLDWKPGEVVLGLYEVVGVLGQGGMGRVYRVRHRGWGLDLAVKAPLPDILEATGGADLFEKEAETWVNLGLHPHVVTCYYVRRAFDLPLVFAELADGGSLLDAIRDGRLKSAESILDVAVQSAWGLHYAHEQGLVHRDVKPANVLLGSDGAAKVTDFGLARARKRQTPGPRMDPSAGGGHTMTVEGGGGGTPAYLSPEQAGGDALTRRSDLWSFALSVLEMFVGARTWEHGLAAPEVLEEYKKGGLATPGRPAMPGPVQELLERCFRETPEDRPRDLAVVADVLKGAWEGLTGGPYPRRAPRGGRGSPDGMNNRALSLVDLGRVAEAGTLWRRSLEAAPQHPEATYNEGLTAWRSGRLDDSEFVRRMDDVCATHSTSARAHQLSGRIRLLVGQGTEAQAALARATQLGGTADLATDIKAAAAPTILPGQALRGLRGPVSALTLTADGHTVIAAHGEEARVWDAASGTVLKTLSIPEGPVHALVAMPDGRFLLVAAEKAALTLWDLVSGQEVKSWIRQAGYVTSLALLQGGRLVASGGSDRVVRLWDPATGRCAMEMKGHEDAVTAVAAGETCVASASRDGTVRLWAVEDGRSLGVLEGHDGRVNAVLIREEESRVVSAGEDHTVRDWGLNSRELVRSYRSHSGAVHALAWASDGRVLSGSADRSVRTWDLDGERLAGWEQLDAAVVALAVTPEGQVWAAHGSALSALRGPSLALPAPALCRPSSAIEVEDRAESFEDRLQDARRALEKGDLSLAVSLARNARGIKGHERSPRALELWDELCARLPRAALQSAWEEGVLSGHTDVPVSLAIAPDGARALSASRDASVRLWDLGARRATATLSGHDGAVTSVAFMGGGGRALTGGRDRTVRVWDLAGSRLLSTLEGHGENVSAVDVSPAGALVVSASWDGTVRLWDLRQGAEAHVLEGHGAQVTAVCFASDGLAVASAGFDGTVRLWETATGEPLTLLEGHEGNVTAVALHPTGRSVASGGADGTVRLWDPRARRVMRTLRGHEGEVSQVEFTPAGRFLVSAGRDRTVRVWDLRRGTEVRLLKHPGAVHGIALSPLGNVLLAGVADDHVHAWHLDWEPEDPSGQSWEEIAKPFLETYVSRRRGSLAPTQRMTVTDADLDGLLDDLHRRGFGGLTRETIRPRLERMASTGEDAPSYWETLKRDAPAALRAAPREAVGAVKRFPWGKAALAVVAAAAFVVGVRSWFEPEARVILSPYMEEAVRKEIDLVDVEAFASSCDPASSQAHLDRVLAGTPSAQDVACVAAASGPGTVAAILDRAPLEDQDPTRSLALVRNAASVLAGVQPTAVDALCARLADPRVRVRQIVGMALAGGDDPAFAACVRNTLTGGHPLAIDAAVFPFRQHLARGTIGVDEGWTLIHGLLQSPEPVARMAGLEALPMYTARVSEPLAQPLLEDPVPAVVEAAKRSLQTIKTVHTTDLLRGNVKP